MKAKAREPYVDNVADLPEVVSGLDYDAHRAIRYRPDHAVWKDENRNFELQAFYPGWVFDHTVQILEIVDGAARPMGFSADDFEYRAPLDASAFEALAFPGASGFRLHYPLNRNDYRDELITFLGSSYFRALGRGNVYGLSARGLAVDTAGGNRGGVSALHAILHREAGARGPRDPLLRRTGEPAGDGCLRLHHPAGG